MHRRYEHINIPIEIVRTIVAVAEYGSYSKAGTKLALSQPAISAQIKRLQLMVGGEVFRRTQTGIMMTDRGALVVAHARKMLEANDQILALGGGASQTQPIRLGISALYAQEFFKLPMSRDVKGGLSVVCAHATEIERNFLDGYLDIVCLFNPSEHCGEAEKEWSEDIVWSRDREFVLSPGSPIPLIMPPDSPHHQPAIQALEKAKLPYRIVFTSNDYAGRIAAVESGIGVTTMPVRQVKEPLIVADDYYLPKLAPTRGGIFVRPQLATREIRDMIDHLAQLAPAARQSNAASDLAAPDRTHSAIGAGSNC